MSLGTISLIEDNGSIISNLIRSISLLPIWLLIIAGVYIIVQIIHLVIYRDIRRFALYNIVVILVLLFINLITDIEISKTVIESTIFDDGSFVGTKLVSYIIHSVILIVGIIVSLIDMIFGTYRINDYKTSDKSNTVSKVESMMLIISGGLLSMIIGISFFAFHGPRANITFVYNASGVVRTQVEISVPINEDKEIRFGTYRVALGESNEDQINVMVEQQSNGNISQTLKWNTSYKVEAPQGNDDNYCAIKFIK